MLSYEGELVSETVTEVNNSAEQNNSADMNASSDLQTDEGKVYYQNGTYIICVMSNNYSSEYAAVTGIQKISRTVYNYINQ